MRWKILKKFQIPNARLAGFPRNAKFQIEKIIKILLENRGLKTEKQQKEFLNPKPPEKLTSKEVGISLAQLRKAVRRIKEAIKNNQKIIVYGDYDTDGVCATAILWETIYRLGGDVMPFIPKRKEGYGIKVQRLEQMAKEGVKLIITVDQGIVAVKQAQKAKKLGLDLIITDHHIPGEKKPQALAIIHTTKLAGSGVAWFLARHLGGETGLDLATIGTVSDVVPLIGPNRSIVKFGLKAVQKTPRIGLLSLYQIAGITPQAISTYEIGYLIGPRLNASGRMDDPLESLRLICTRNKERAAILAKKIEEKNRQRQTLTERLVIHARNLWLTLDGKSSLIFVQDKSYEEGVIGLVAGKLAEEFYRPAVVLAPRENHWVASARSIEEFNIIEAIRDCAEFLGPHGGHPRAAGFTVETTKIEILKNRLIQIAEEKLDKEKLKPTLIIDTELDLGDLSLGLYEQLNRLAPFGEGNPQPVFASRDVQIVDAYLVGNGSQHLKLRLTSHLSRLTFDAIGFGMANFFPQLSPEKSVDIAYNLSVDEWNGQRRLQLKLKDIKIKNGPKI
ncbi:MAG: single-stranded-DNA-specific exonuclease RecJ [Microgenomates group bacterium]